MWEVLTDDDKHEVDPEFCTANNKKCKLVFSSMAFFPYQEPLHTFLQPDSNDEKIICIEVLPMGIPEQNLCDKTSSTMMKSS